MHLTMLKIRKSFNKLLHHTFLRLSANISPILVKYTPDHEIELKFMLLKDSKIVIRLIVLFEESLIVKETYGFGY